ncbi:ABC transporter ATP-binding protein [Microbacterium sp. NPDC077184]|uniref:ABC transporter ATP-binding protein n=1 Tax=Microbacterium sp. NPDC077184 TaxID=3154764 RepID=UPI00342FBD02
MTASLAVDGIGKTFGDAPALRDLSLRVERGSCTAILGPSGSGKSTILRVIAGLESPDTGRVLIDGRDMASVPAERRGVGLVFQKALLFPHLDVRDNVAFSARVSGVPRRAARERAERYLELVHLSGFGARRVGELSGGQEQRVAIARALAAEPAVLLLDEPFSALDGALRADMHALIDDLRADVGPTIVLVTHDREEASRVADRIAVVEHGELLHEGTVAEAYRAPSSLRVAELMGGRNAFPGVVTAGVHRSALGVLPVPDGEVDGPATLLIRQEDIGLAAPDDDSASLAGTVTETSVAGARTAVAVRVGDSAIVHAELAGSARLGAGDRVALSLPTGAIHLVRG